MSESKPTAPAPVAATQTIVLLEQNKNAVSDPNGTFSINLPKPITLKEGDELQLTKAFVDTSLEDSNVINVSSEERSVSIQTGIYFTDVTDNQAGSTPGYGLWSEENRPNDPCRGQTYILQDQDAANLNTFFDWLGTNNPAVTPAPVDFNVELVPLADSDPTSPLIGKAEYIIKGAPDLVSPPVPADPAAQNTALVQANMLNGYMNLKVVNDAHQFFFYHRDSTAPTFDDPNGHTAIIEGWFDSTGKRKGWRAKRNVDTTFASGNPPYTRWFFKSDDGTDGYNYFADRGTGHLVRLTQAFFPFNKSWLSSSDPNAIDYTPSVTMQYKNPSLQTEKQYQTMTKNFTKYIPFEDPGYPINDNAGVTYLYLRMTDSSITPNPINRAVEVKFKNLPEEYKKKEYGWGRNWAWFYWNDWEDPEDIKSQRVWDPIVFSIDEPPVIAYTNYKSQTPPNSQPIDQAFVNSRSQYYTRVEGGKDLGPTYEGNRLQLNQITTTPVSNPTSDGCIMSPRQYTTTIDIPPKAYGYAELAQLITDKLNALANPIVGVSNNPADLNQPLNAPGFTSSYLFQTTYDLMMQYNGFNTAAGGAEIPKNPIFPNPWTFSKVNLPARPDDGVPDAVVAVTDPAGEGVQPFWVNEEGDILFSFNQSTTNGSAGGAPRIVGAENMSLIFDDVTQSFNFLEAHTPFYIRGPEIQAAGTNPTTDAVFGPGPEVIYQLQGRSTTTSFRPTLNTKDVYSGCFITDLQPRTLWFDKMKFSADILTHIAPDGGQVTNFQTGSFSGDTSLAAVKTHPVSLTTGRNKTGFFIGHDTLVTKNENFDTMTAKPSTDDYWNEIVEVDTPVGLKANSQTPVNDDQAFYQIEISGINSQEITGQVYNNSLVQAIVGKYFSAGNFTQSIGDGVPYVHKGEPLTIRSVRVRILNTQNELEEGLGPNSSFVLTINTEK